ncbi:MAG: hypothetical protein ACFCUX_07795 [Candidatus Methylacidiphilales bacterium]
MFPCGIRAGMLAGGYFLITSAYILISDHVLLTRGLDAETMADWQIAKGLVFMAVTSLVLFLP